jgi:molybdopterin converting factor subunit 1
MTVRVLFFSVLRDITGAEEVLLDVPQGESVAGLLSALFSKWPALQKWDQSLLIAVDQTYAKRDAALHDNAEVAIMPPVQGG